MSRYKGHHKCTSCVLNNRHRLTVSIGGQPFCYWGNWKALSYDDQEETANAPPNAATRNPFPLTSLLLPPLNYHPPHYYTLLTHTLTHTTYDTQHKYVYVVKERSRVCIQPRPLFDKGRNALFVRGSVCEGGFVQVYAPVNVNSTGKCLITFREKDSPLFSKAWPSGTDIHTLPFCIWVC